YHGWQLQKDLPTIQGEVEKALQRILVSPTRVYGAGRTDAGVHAIGQVAHFVTQWSRSSAELMRAVNAVLPKDIVVRELHPVEPDFHARHSAHCKTYKYHILNRPIRSAIQRAYSWHLPNELDINAMEAASGHLLGSHDFRTFGQPTDGTPSTVREMLRAHWVLEQPDGRLTFTITGTGFLRYMVRSIVGTLVLVGRGAISESDFMRFLASCDRSLAGPTAPPHGLFLESVEYSRPIEGRCHGV
ncbi:MAG: tRNA pseudouridine(38-40) synthase TruA, partial [Pseudomonadota bacterium]